MSKPRAFPAVAALIIATAIWFNPSTAHAATAARASVHSVRHWPQGDYTRVVIDLDAEVQYEEARITDPDRIFLDISNARLGNDFLKRNIAVTDEFLTQIRAAQNRPDVVRIVFDIANAGDYSISELHDPFRIIIDLRNPSGRRRGSDPLPQTPAADSAKIASEPDSKPIQLASQAEPEKAQVSMPDPADRSAPTAQVAEPKTKRAPSTVAPGRRVQTSTTASSSVQNIRYWPTTDSTRVVVDLDSDTPYECARLTGPDRVYFDISNARLSGDFPGRTIVTGDEFLDRIRVAQNRPDMVRVVLDISGVDDYTVSELQNPFRIVIDLQGRHGTGTGTRSIAQSFTPRPDEIMPESASSPPDAVPTKPATAGMQTPVEVNVVTASEKDVAPDGQDLARSAAEIELSSAELARAPISSAAPATAATQTPGAVRLANATSKPTTQSYVSPGDVSPARRPFTISGTLTSGFYSAYTRGGGNGNQKIRFVPAGAAFDINGYYLTPDLLDYSIQPELNASPQASDAGFQGGSGIRLRVTALGRRAIPVTLRYSNVQLEDVYFGSLSQLSSYTLKNRTRELGLTTQLKRAGLPTATIDWGISSVQSQSLISVIPDYFSHSNHRNLDLNYQKGGWDFRGFAGSQQQTSDLFAPGVDGLDSSVLYQKVNQYRGSARRTFLRDSEFYIDAGSQSTSNILLDRPVDLTSYHGSVNLRMFQTRRWKASFRTGYTSNISDLLLTGLVSGLGSSGSVAPDSSVLVPLQRTTSSLNLGGLTSVDLSHGLGMYASVDRTSVTPVGNSSLSSNYLTTAGGVTYSKAFGWGNISGQYGRSYGNGSITGQRGRIEGQNYIVTAQPGNWENLQLNFSVRGTDQKITNELPAREHSFASEGTIGFGLFGQFRTRLGGGWQQSSFMNLGNDFHTRGYTAQAAIEHPRFQITGSLNSSFGNSLQAYDQLFSGIGTGSVLLTPMQLIPSDFKGATLSLHALPTRKLEISALYSRSIQHLEGLVANDFEVIDVSMTYNLRKLKFVVGYFDSTQIYSSYSTSYPETERGRFYLRVSRSVGF